MKPNVFIRARRCGKLFYQWEGHNTWTQHGREYLASLLAFASYDPDTPVIPTSRIKHMQFGLGSITRGSSIPAIDAAYPVGFDPHATTGGEYNHLYPEVPLIGTLERPVRFTGTENPYASADPADVWLSDPAPPKFLVEYPNSNEVSFTCFVDGRNGDVAYGSLTVVSLTEAGLVLSGDADINDAYNPIVAYVNFEPLVIMNEVEAEFTWVVGF